MGHVGLGRGGRQDDADGRSHEGGLTWTGVDSASAEAFTLPSDEMTLKGSARSGKEKQLKLGDTHWSSPRPSESRVAPPSTTEGINSNPSI